ncbi:tetratricopeptide repeat protein [Limnoraphis robusta]|uniref:tetratricopeptide repeat protein n=1 Tax=Limnoraphis robusta TaxID=1118279 RepID=UPI002B20A14C|nr:tetratricopeptide repeat protein [Limnoraphis robusta]
MVSKFQEANQLQRSGQLEEAVGVYRQAIAENPDFYWSYHNLGETLCKLGRLDEAVEVYGQAVALNASAAWSHLNLGEALEKLGKTEEAIAVYQQAVQLKPQFQQGIEILGKLTKTRSQFEESVSSLNEQNTGRMRKNDGSLSKKRDSNSGKAISSSNGISATESQPAVTQLTGNRSNFLLEKITILLLNYRRPQNIPKIVESLRNQTVPVQIFLWDNSSDTNIFFSDIDLVFKASQNQGCSPRWFMALYAKTKYIMTHDDDFLITRSNVLENIVECLENQQNSRTIVGLEGIVVNPKKTYSEHIGYKSRYKFHGNKYGSVIPAIVYKSGKNLNLITSERVHLVKGRLMATRTENIVFHIDLPTLMREREDDIAVSAMIGQRKRIHLIPSFLKDCIEELEMSNSIGNKDQPNHFQSRNHALKRYFFNVEDIDVNNAINSENSSLKYQNRRQRESKPVTFNSLPRLFIVVPFNDVRFLESCLKSIEMQTYRNFKCIVVDDSSEQDYSSEVRRILSSTHFELIVNQCREYALKSRVIAIERCVEQEWISDEDVIVHIDGDDWLADQNSLLKIAEAYSDGYTWVTYGGARRLEKGKLSEPFMHALSNKQIEEEWGRKVSPKYPEQVISNRSYRDYPWGACHCRTFKYKLYKEISEDDFQDSTGNYFRYATDMAIFIPVLEMAGDRIKYIEETIYIYNRDTGEKNVANEFKHQHGNHNYIRKKPKYDLYVESEFFEKSLIQ